VYPLVSCVCPTVGKLSELEESIQSFIDQTYPNKELIVFNNYPYIDFDMCGELRKEHNIKIINYKAEIKGSTGECRNIGNSYVNGEYICVWDDDDIFLKDRISNLMSHILNTGYDAVLGYHYILYGNVLEKKTLHNSNIIYKKEFWMKNNYSVGNDEDQYMLSNLRTHGKMIEIAEDHPQYLYRWGNGTYHISGQGADKYIGDSRNRIIDYTKSLLLPAKYILDPKYKKDYQQLVNLKFPV